MFKGGNLTFTFLRKYEALWNLEQSQIHKYAKYGPHWNHGKKSEIRKYAKYAKYGPLWNYGKKSEIRKYAKYAKYGPLWDHGKNLKYVNTSNTGHFEILKKNLKYVNTSNTLNTEYFKILKEKSQIRKYVKYAKYGPLWNLEKSQIRKYVKYAKYGPLWNLEEKIWNK